MLKVVLSRDDGRDALKIYTDPDYFFNLWREAMQKEMRDAKEKRREQRKKEVSAKKIKICYCVASGIFRTAYVMWEPEPVRERVQGSQNFVIGETSSSP